MSISSISTANVAQATDNSAKTQLEREQRKVDTDTAARAEQAAPVAEASAGRAVEGTLGTTVDMYL